MIIVRLWGGLGNQMFQYAYGYSVAKRNATNLLLDTSFYTDEFIKSNPRFTNQEIKITDYSLCYSDTINAGAKIPLVPILHRKTINRIIRIPKHFSMRCGNRYRYIKETRFEYSKYLNTLMGNNLYLDGYWQSPKYFEKYAEEIREQFYVDEQPIVDEADRIGITQDDDSVAIHIRMGDYAMSKNIFVNGLYLLPFQYYKNAMNEIKRYMPSQNFYVFTNDVEKARIVFEDISEITYANEERRLSDLQEMHLMSMCKHQIIANSTYSWWAAWLNKNERKIICSPNIVFANKDIIPEDWKKISIK